MEVTKENIEFIKRRLKDYGYYTEAIRKSDIKLIELRERIKDCYKASGVSYDGILNSSDPNYSRTNELVNEEYSEVLYKEELMKKRNHLALDNLLNQLSNEQYDLIRLHYFEGYSQNYIAVNKQYKYIEALKRKMKKTIVFLVKKY